MYKTSTKDIVDACVCFQAGNTEVFNSVEKVMNKCDS